MTSRRIKGRNGLSPVCTHYWIGSVLDWLVTQGLAQRATEFGSGHYRLLHRFRLQVAEAAGQVVYDKLADLRRRQMAAQARRGGDELMYRLRRLRFERIGHSDARFRSLVLDLTSGEVAVADESDNRSVDAIVWLRNGGGKSSLLALLYSLLLPAKVDFIGHSRKWLANYVVGGAAAHVIAEWEDDAELWAGPVLIIGAVYQWKNGHRPRDLEHAWDDLIRRWYLFRPIPGVLTLDTLPIRDDAACRCTAT